MKYLALVRFAFAMNVSVNIAIVLRSKGSGTDFTGVGLDATVCSHMLLTMFWIGECSMTYFAFVRSLAGMNAAYVYLQQSPAFVALKYINNS